MRALSNWEGWLDEIGELVKELIALPAQASRVLTRMERGELNVNMPQVNRHLSYVEGAMNRVAGRVDLRGVYVERSFASQ